MNTLVLIVHAALLTQAPAEVLAACEQKFNAQDVDASLSCFTDNATVTLIVDPVVAGATPAVPDSVFRGRDAIREFLEVYLRGFKLAADGERAELRNEYLQSLGVESAVVSRTVTARGGKLESLALRFDKAARDVLVVAIPAANKAVVRRFYDGVNKVDRSVFKSTVSPGFIQHTVMPAGPGRAGLEAFYEDFWKAFTVHFTIEDLIAEGDKVSARMTGRYVHKGTWLGIKATGKAVVAPRIAIFRVWGGRVVEHWDQVDRLGMLQQLGAIDSVPTWTASPGYEGFR